MMRMPQLKFWQCSHLPVVLQIESAECGLASIAMIAAYHGQHVDLATLRRRYSVSMKGTTLKGLITVASGLGLQCRPLKLEMEHLSQLKLPCILHWDMNHFVVLKEVRNKRVTIHDPATGIRKLTLNDVAEHFTGIALELTPGTNFAAASPETTFTMRSLMGNVIGLNRGLIQLLLLGVVLQVFSLVSPFYMQWVVDEALIAADRDLVTVLGIGFALLVLLQTIVSAVRSWVTTVMATHLNFQWLENAFTHLMKLPLPYFEKRHLGDIVSRFGSIETIQHSLTTQVVEGVVDGLLVVGTFAVMLLYSPALTLAACVAVVLYILLRWSIFQSLKNANAEQIVHAAKQQTHFLESARGVQSIRLFNRTDERRVGWMNLLADQFNAQLRISKLSVSYQAANTLLFGIERIVVIWLAALAVLDTRFSIGMLFAFISYKDQFSQRIASLIDKLFELRMLRLHGERVADILMVEPENQAVDGELQTEQLEASFELRDVCFRYADGEPYILKNVSLAIPAGQCIAVTGGSGCGKTTLVKLILGLLEPTEGEILVGGMKLSSVGLANYRNLLGTVMQDDYLFAGSIADNIAFFDPSPQQERIERCAQMAAIDSEINAMPMCYNTLIGDIGTGLSGGQKQRILLARALYKDPKALILDEATSHLDVWNEQLVNAAIERINMTRVLVAHRPETIAMAQRVIVLSEGQIIQDLSQAQVREAREAALRQQFGQAA
ncbi:peptidase domain-containing ABC transporter [Pseudoduganella chitinolytica]|uniref:Peptidase domain-containing ABC transporter n=1 Tax=Pseudoduganella chitinolytica TaxID=34070 RepID=A0ABY8BLV8_9BURK|nr:peptidase domain-containing ABC transporter [Pseudoduganella chitinolytica]WEF35359.1 peptidase domain-containing ABC transporter [Pseudoduganella chitinolytica]